MKKLNFIIAGFALLAIFTISSCASGSEDNDATNDTTIVHLEEKMDNIEAGDSSNVDSDKATDALGKEYTSKYICPDHCKGSGSDKEGKCPKCGMDLMDNPNSK